MAGKTFNPNDFRKGRKPAKEPELSPIPEPDKKPKATKSRKAAAPSPVIQSATGKPSVKLIDTISLEYEPVWERVLNNVGVAYN